MAIRTMSFLSLVQSSITTTDIFKSGYRFKMFRSNTMTNTTQVVKVESFGDWSYQQFVGKTMDEARSAIAAVGSERAITITISGSSPYPTGTQGGVIIRKRATPINLCKEAAFSSMIPLHLNLLSGVMRWAVDAVPPLSIVPERHRVKI